MLLQCEPAMWVLNELRTNESWFVYRELLTTSAVRSLSKWAHITFISGYYEGFNQSVPDRYVDQELSIWDYILTNGTFAAAVIIDGICRYIPSVLGNEKSLSQDSFNDGLLAPPQYNQPHTFENVSVPDVLLSGNHQDIKDWRQTQRNAKTRLTRPDLLAGYCQLHKIDSAHDEIVWQIFEFHQLCGSHFMDPIIHSYMKH